MLLVADASLSFLGWLGVLVLAALVAGAALPALTAALTGRRHGALALGLRLVGGDARELGAGPTLLGARAWSRAWPSRWPGC